MIDGKATLNTEVLLLINKNKVTVYDTTGVFEDEGQIEEPPSNPASPPPFLMLALCFGVITGRQATSGTSRPAVSVSWRLSAFLLHQSLKGFNEDNGKQIEPQIERAN